MAGIVALSNDLGCGAARAVGVSPFQSLLMQVGARYRDRFTTAPAPWKMLIGPGVEVPDAPSSSAHHT